MPFRLRCSFASCLERLRHTVLIGARAYPHRELGHHKDALRRYQTAGSFPLKSLTVGKSVAQNLNTTAPLSLSQDSALVGSATVTE
jgi:hypothetical protein